MQTSFVAIIPAAGSSTRMAAAKPKTLLDLGGRVVLERSVSAFHATGLFSHIVVLVRPSELDFVQQLLLGMPEVVVAAGGAERQDSVRAGLIVAKNLASPALELDNCYVLVHDAARCLVSKTVIQRVVDEVKLKKAVTAAMPMVDSLKRADSTGKVEDSVSREGVWAIQTPQAFSFNLLWHAHQDATAYATDDCALVEKMHPVYVVEGERLNFKLTTPEDFEIARCLVAAGKA